MKCFINTKAVFVTLALFISCFVFSQSTMLAYNDGMPIVTLSSGIVVTIQGGYMSQRKSSVDGQIDNQGTIEVSGDFVNNNSSSEAFSSSRGLVSLNGSSAMQNINGTYDPGFYDLTLNNTYSTFPQLAINISSSVKNTLTMSAGNVNLISNTFTLGSSAASAGTLSYTGGVLYGGTFKRWFGTSSFSIANAAGHFPMGTSASEYRPLWVAYTSNLTTGGTVGVLHAPNYPAGTIAASHADASWGQTLAGVSRSSWTVSTANSFAFNGSTGIIRFGGAGFTQFVLTDLNASLVSSVVGTYAASTSANTALEVNRTGLSTANLGNSWKVGTIDLTTSPLPVELLSFNATPSVNVVEITWSTVSEFNSDYFVVQRAIDGVTFEDVVKKSAAGYSSSIKNYSAVDSDPYDGVSYYRLKQVDLNGDFHFSNIVPVEFHSTNTSALNVYPMPSSGDFNVSFAGEKGKHILLVIRNILGQEFYIKEFILDKDLFLQPVNLSGIVSPGMYMITAFSDGKTFSKKIVIE